MAKLGAMRTPTAGLRRPSWPRSASSALVVPPGGADDDVDATLDAVGDVGGRGVRHGELDDHVRPAEVAEVVTLVEAPHQLEPVGGLAAAHTSEPIRPAAPITATLISLTPCSLMRPGPGPRIGRLGRWSTRKPSSPSTSRPPWGPRSGPSTPTATRSSARRRTPTSRPTPRSPWPSGRPAAARGGRPHRRAPRRSTACRDRRGQRTRLRQPDAHEDWLAARSPTSAPTRASACPSQPTAGHPDRLLGAQRGQGDARRPPAHHHRRRRAGPDAGAPRPPRRSGRTTSATGARRSACSSSTCSTSARTPPRRGCWPPTRTRSTRRRGREFDAADPTFADAAPGAPRSSLLQAGDPTRCASGTSSSTCPRPTSTRSTRPSGVTLTDERPGRRVDVQRRSWPAICDELEARGHRDVSATARCASSSTATPGARASRCR